MTHQQILDYCLKKAGAYIDYPFEPNVPIVKVRAPSQDKGKIFAQVFTLKGEPKVTLNCCSDSAEFYRGIYPGSVTRGYHCPPVQQPYFNTVSLDGTVPDDVIIDMIDHAYNVVYVVSPGAQLAVINAAMTDGSLTENGEPHTNWSVYSEQSDSRIPIIDDMSPFEITQDMSGIINNESSVYIITFEFQD